MLLQLLFVPHIPQELFSCSKGLPGINYPAGIRHWHHPGCFSTFPTPSHLFLPPGEGAEPFLLLLGALGPFGSAAGREGEAGQSSPPTWTKTPTSNPHTLLWRVESFKAPTPSRIPAERAQPCSPAQLCRNSCSRGGLIPDFHSRSFGKNTSLGIFLHSQSPGSPWGGFTWARLRASALLIFSSSISLAMSCLAW